MQLVLRHNMLRNELNSDVARFTTQESNCLKQLWLLQVRKVVVANANLYFFFFCEQDYRGSAWKVAHKRKNLMSINFYARPSIYCLYFIYSRNNNTAVEIHLKA